ncbi:MAG: tetratricopeptide repeat protein [Deltaproteobacteria bacterium]|nr:tetratricopeptide repeat protein [Deltaproteobacteria bacterium]
MIGKKDIAREKPQGWEDVWGVAKEALMIGKKDKYQVNKEKAYEHQQAALKFIKKKKIHEAINELKEATRCDPFCPNHFNNLGYYYWKIGQVKEAAVYGRRCFELIDGVISTYRDLVCSKFVRDAIADVADDEVISGLENRTHEEIRADADEEIKDYADMLAGAGSIMDIVGDPDAKRCLETSIYLNPNCWIARYNLGLYYLKRDLTEDAISEYSAAYKFNKQDPGLITNLSYLYNSVGMIEESISLIDAYKKDHPLTNDMLYILADNYYGLKHDSEVLTILKKIVNNEPQSAFAHAAIADMYAHLGWKSEAYKEINIAKSLNKEEKEQGAENIIKKVLKWLDDPDDDNNTMLFLFLLMLMKKKMNDKKNLKR